MRYFMYVHDITLVKSISVVKLQSVEKVLKIKDLKTLKHQMQSNVLTMKQQPTLVAVTHVYLQELQ